MAENESIGGVSVQITGDVSQLQAALGSAVSIAGAAGGKVAGAFNAGAEGAEQFTGAVEAGAAAEGEFAGATEVANAALGHQVTQIQAVSGTLRTLEGNGGIRAAERFLTLIPGLGAALQFAFPVVGAIALTKVFGEMAEKAIGAKESINALAKATQSADDTFEKDLDNIERVNVALQTMQFGSAAGTKLQGFYTKEAADRDIDQARALNAEVQAMENRAAQFHLTDIIPHYGAEIRSKEQADIGAKQAEQARLQGEAEIKRNDARLQGAEQEKDANEQAGQLAAKQIEGAEKAASQAAEISKQKYTAEIDGQHNAETQRIAGLASEYAKVVQTGQEEIRFEKAKQDEINGYALATRDRTVQEIAAKAGAESAGKSQPELKSIQATAQIDTQTAKNDYTLTTGKAALDVQAAQQKGTLALIELNQRLAETLSNDVREGWDKVGEAAKKTQAAVNAAAEKDIVGQQRVAEIRDKSAGDVKALQIKGQEIALEGKYGEQVSHTLAEQVSYLQQIASLEAQANADTIVGLEAQKKDAEAIADTASRLAKVAEIEGRIAALKQQGANQQTQTANQIGAVQAEASLGSQLGAAGESGLSSLSNALAKGVTDGGKGLGKDIRQSLQGIGREMLGDAIKKGVEEMVIAVTGNTIATNLNTVWTEVLTLVSKIPFFADGTDSAPGGFAMVGERGPEIMHVPRGSQVIPNHKIKGYADGTRGAGDSTYHSTAFQTGTTNLHFHAHGMSDPNKFIDHVMRKLPETLKRRSPQFSPYAH